MFKGETLVIKTTTDDWENQFWSQLLFCSNKKLVPKKRSILKTGKNWVLEELVPRQYQGKNRSIFKWMTVLLQNSLNKQERNLIENDLCLANTLEISQLFIFLASLFVYFGELRISNQRKISFISFPSTINARDIIIWLSSVCLN